MNLYKKIVVYNWINYNKYNTHELYVYKDDNIENAIAKIAKTLNNNSRFYAWLMKSNKSILFKIKNIKWDGYSPNPILSKNKNSPQLKEPIIYEYNIGLFPYNYINIIFENDFTDLNNNPYYFNDKSFLSLAELNKKESFLNELEKIDTKPIIDTSINIHRYELKSKLNKYYTLVDIFEQLNTSPIIEFIQWINDNYKIIYKLHKINKLSKEKLLNWTDTKKINIINCINCYSILNSGTYAKLTINQDMNITLSYNINLRKTINWKEIYDSIESITKYINFHLKHKIVFNELSIKANLIIEIENVSITNLKKKISEVIDIFDIMKSNKDTINLIYKRSSNYDKKGFDALMYIKNCLYLGIDDNDIINQLVILNNMSQEDAKVLLKQEQELLYEMEIDNIKQQENINKTNTIVIIELYKNGFFINIINIPNKNELDYLIYWISKIISSSVQKNVKRKIDTKKPEPTPKKLPSSPSPIPDDDDLGKLSYSSSDSNSSINSNRSEGGGALGKDKHSYFINLLTKADKDLFANNYARNKCQAINQPVVFSNEYKETLKKNGNYFFDNDLTYGSKENIKNVYACPRLWCPISKIPLDVDNGKTTCPIEDEEPMEMYFDNDPHKKRYVKLIKPDENNICAPCCFKKQPKDEELNKCKYYNDDIKKDSNKNNEPLQEIDKDENYLMNTSPVRIGRFGSIPQSLHELFFPTLKYSICSKMLNKNDKCFVRKGISHKTSKKIKNIHNDSIIHSIAYGLNFKSKEHLISDINKKLDLFTYMSLENGNVCKAFMDKLPIIPSNNKTLIDEFKYHIKKFNLDNKLPNITDTNYKLSRLLGIFKSYKKFMLYLSSNDYPITKSPYYLYSLISIIYNVLLVIWDKQPNEVSIICPYYTSYDDLIGSMELNPQILMLIKDDKYYEPIELKTKGNDGEKLIHLNDFKHIKYLFKECSIAKDNYNENNTIYNNLFSLYTWIKSEHLKMYKKFIITTIIINNDLSITHFLTKDNFFIIIDKISISFLPRIIINLGISNIIFYDDIIDNVYEPISVLKSDYDLFINKCNDLNIHYDFGIIDKSLTTSNEYYYSLTIQRIPLTNDIIHSRIIDDLYKYQFKNYKINKKWFQLQLMIYSKIINLNDDLFNNLLSLPKNERIKELFKELNLLKIPEKSKIRIILEEIPFISKKHIKNFLNDFIIYNKYDFLNPLIIETKNQFIFSQIALNNNIPQQLLIYHQATPNNNFNSISFQTKDYIYNDIIKEPEIPLPEIFKGTMEKLNSKWVMHKKSKWSNMVYIKNTNYDINYIKDFYLWFASILNIKTTYNDLISIAYNDMKSIFNTKLNNTEKIDIHKYLLKELFDDPYLSSIINKYIGKNYINFNIFWDKYYIKEILPDDTIRKQFIYNILHNYGNIFPNDYFILAMSKILNINIITIHRSKYGANKENPVVRGDLEDLLLSSTFYKSPINYENRPLIILYKYDNDKNIIYNLIIDKNSTIDLSSIYIKLNDIPLAIKYLIDEHLKNI
jgi:hypothetical protein